MRRSACAFLLVLSTAFLCAGGAHAQYSEPLVSARHGMVVTAQHLATEVGVSILKQGGNAIDAAVAVGYAEAVVYPCCGNIGGGGFMTLHLANGQNLFLDLQWLPDVVAAEPEAFKPEVQAALEKMGYKFRDVGHLGDVEAIVVNPKTGLLESVNDPRSPAGLAAGY